mmetsp:Transcript_16662/g.28118  ORF Transcript_16662/g.28118 Transcript_16662/m.28118 type:complete len:248 (-) Transcript_16662:351-1094(-)|eukprot:CAMPEP_0198210370 /NCGR_PEP_ID=MMETSP1445-20131203/20063_1 /TAXON_ID=36898 /ORGANISM="Pyramimonas sp., Strain CCMP2087" /LENGTH=247 /DNA_ID=CAMNT_0043884413 /DNA_START=157 /DNA_END=900 /DNA_ORIENTATION=-
MVNKEAIEIAKRAVEHDNKGQWQDAVTCYEQAAAFILKENPSDADKKVAVNYKNRATDLKQKLAANQFSVQAQVAQQGMQAAGTVNQGVSTAGGVKPMAGAAAVGAAAGLVAMGPITAVACAGAAAYCTTRSDKAGDVARSTGAAVVSTFDKAKAYNDEHNFTGKAKDAAVATAQKAAEVNQKYKITDRIGGACSLAMSKAKAIEEKHQISSKVGGALSAGMDKVTATMNGKKAAGSTAGPLPPVPQ